MTFYEKYLQGVEWGKIQVFVWPLVTGAYAYLTEKHVPQPVAVIVCVVLGIILVILALIQPKAAEQLATDPKVIAAGAKAAIQPVVDQVQDQVTDAVTDTVADAAAQVQAAGQQIGQIGQMGAAVSAPGLDPMEIAARMEKAAAILKGESL